MSAIISDDGFSLQQPHVSSAPKIAKELLEWLSHHDHNAAGTQFTQNLTTCLEVCFVSKGQSMKIKREKMWGLYHKLRTSVDFAASWTSFLQQSINTEACPIFFQYITNFVFKEMIKRQYPIEPKQSAVKEVSLTYEEANALRYSAGYIPRTLVKKLKKSAHPLHEELSLCLLDLVDDGDDDNQSQDWIKTIDRGGLIHVNNMMYQLCVALELALRRHLCDGTRLNFEDAPNKLCQDENVQYYLSIVSANWEEEEREALIPMLPTSGSLFVASHMQVPGWKNIRPHTTKLYKRQKASGNNYLLHYPDLSK